MRGQGAGNQLLEAQEEYAQSKEFTRIGLGVGFYKDYGSAQRLYVKRGYIPDGHGVMYKYQSLVPGEMVRLDDNLNLCLIKTF